MYAALKSLHIACAVVSFSGFLLRGAWMIRGSRLLDHPATRTLPHVVDTVFLLSGLSLLAYLSIDPPNSPWLLAKFTGLVVYVIAGTVALRRGRTQPSRLLALVIAVLVFGYIVGVALYRSPQSWLA